MSSVQQRTTALFAAFALVIGCVLIAAVPQQQAYAANTRLVAGTTFERATPLSIVNDTLSTSNKTEFNAAMDNNYYKFTTSARSESKYKLTVRSYNGEVVYLTVYDATRHRIANMKTKDGSSGARTWKFYNLKPKSVYYIEVWRFVTNVEDYVLSGPINGNGDETGNSVFIHVPYKISLKEQVTKPSISTFKAWSVFDAEAKHKHILKLKFSEPSYNTERVQIKLWWYQNGVKHTFYRYATGSSFSMWTIRWGNSYPYRVSVRPYMTVNGKRVYGKWAKAYVKNKSGNWVKTPEKNKKVAKLVIKDK